MKKKSFLTSHVCISCSMVWKGKKEKKKLQVPLKSKMWEGKEEKK